MEGEGPCNVGSVVYFAEVTSPNINQPKNYVGSTNNFNIRLYRHRQAFRDINLKTDCQLSEFVWSCKYDGFMPKVKFKVLRKVQQYSPEAKKCCLCVLEKLEILKRVNDPNNLNNRSEIMAKCRHRRKFLLSNIDTRGHVMREMDHSIGNQRDIQDTVFAANSDDIQPWPVEKLYYKRL